MSTLPVAADLDEPGSDALEDGQPLVARTGSEQVLTKVVPVIVDHELSEVVADFIQEELHSD